MTANDVARALQMANWLARHTADSAICNSAEKALVAVNEAQRVANEHYVACDNQAATSFAELAMLTVNEDHPHIFVKVGMVSGILDEELLLLGIDNRRDTHFFTKERLVRRFLEDQHDDVRERLKDPLSFEPHQLRHIWRRWSNGSGTYGVVIRTDMLGDLTIGRYCEMLDWPVIVWKDDHHRWVILPEWHNDVVFHRVWEVVGDTRKAFEFACGLLDKSKPLPRQSGNTPRLTVRLNVKALEDA